MRNGGIGHFAAFQSDPALLRSARLGGENEF
jgi:hypothetical protein